MLPQRKPGRFQSSKSVTSLADWLRLSTSELEWFADLKGLGRGRRDCPQLRHYHYRILAKRSGSIRLLESPKPRLKQLQRQILTHILNEIPLHPAAHGFCKGRSIKTFTAPHVGQRVVLKMDLENFFPSISGTRVQTVFRMIGYPEPIADLLGGICTNAAPREVWHGADDTVNPLHLRETRVLYARPHLPQVLQPLLISRIFVPTGLIAVWQRWQNQSAPRTPDMPTISRFQAVEYLSGAWIDSQPMWPPSCMKRGSPQITARLV